MSDKKIVTLSPDVHPFARYIDGFAEAEAPEFVIDDVIAAGTVVVAGERGLGKTTVLVPLMIAVTGLLKDYPLTASIRRKVVYVCEDAAQVRRIIASLRAGGKISAERDEFNDWFRIVQAKRMPAEQIATVVPEYADLWTDNNMVDGGTYSAPPVVVMDTTNATIDLDNINDNTAVSNAVSTLRQRFDAICLVLIGHVAKASRSDARQLSFIGAGAWEGDTQQSIYLASEHDQRYLIMGKKRFEADATEYLIESYVNFFDAVDKLGRMVEIKCYYGVPRATTEEAKAKIKAERQQAAKLAGWDDMKESVIKYVSANPGCTKTEVKKAVVGRDGDVLGAIDVLEQDGRLEVEVAGKAHKVKVRYGN